MESGGTISRCRTLSKTLSCVQVASDGCKVEGLAMSLHVNALVVHMAVHCSILGQKRCTWLFTALYLDKSAKYTQQLIHQDDTQSTLHADGHAYMPFQQCKRQQSWCQMVAWCQMVDMVPNGGRGACEHTSHNASSLLPHSTTLVLAGFFRYRSKAF